MDTIREGEGWGEANKVIGMGRDGVHSNREIKVLNTEEDRQ
jgi:hypothetical protein